MVYSFTLDISLERLIAFWYHKLQPRKAWKLRAWRGNRPLQIQSQAFEAKGLGTWERTKGDIPTTKHQETFVSPFSVTLPEDIQMRSTTNTDHWWQQKRRTLVSGTPTAGREVTHTDQEIVQQQTKDDNEAQSVTEVSLVSRELLPPIDKSIVRLFELELSKISIHPRPGYDRLLTDDAKVAQ